MPRDFAVLAAVRDPASGKLQSVIYDFAEDALDVVDEALPEDARYHQGLPVDWRKELSWELIQRAPSGEWGAVDVGEVRDLTAAPGGSGLLLFTGGQLLGDLINIGQVRHFLSLDPADMAWQIRHIGGGRGARILHDGHGLIYRIIKDKPELRRSINT